MNWLAHAYLSTRTDEDLLGSILGDFILGVDWRTRYNKKIQQGILTHFEVDRFTDSHPVFIRSCDRISEHNRKYAHVFVDIYYDHYLAKHWKDFSDRKLEDFIDHFYNVLLRYEHILSPKLAQIVPFMVSGNWLLSYRKVWGIQSVIRRLAHRIPRKSTFHEGSEEFLEHYDEFEEDFFEFFPLIVKHIKGR